MVAEKNMESLWKNFSRSFGRFEKSFSGIVSDKNSIAMSRDEVIGFLQDLRDARRNFMRAAGSFDDAWINEHEGKVLTDAARLSDIVAKVFSVTNDELDVAVSRWTTSTGRKTAKPQFTPRFDL